MLQKLKSLLFTFLDKHFLKSNKEFPSISAHKTPLRWFALFLCCMATIGGYYCQNSPASLQTPIMTMFDIKATKFNIIYTVYSLPNFVMPILGGIIIDRLGVKIGLAIFAFLICVGQAFITLGAYALTFNSMIVGNMILGLGLDSLCAAKSAVIVKWFQGQELGLAMGLSLSVSRLGSSISSFLAPWIYVHFQSLTTPLAAGLLLSVGSLTVVGILCLLDYYADNRAIEVETSTLLPKKEFTISGLKNFQLVFYLLIVNCMIAYAVIKGFLNNSSDLMNKRFGFDPELSGKYISVVYILATVLSPVFGAVVDRFGRRTLLILVSLVMMSGVHLFIAFLSDRAPGDPNKNAMFGLVGVGIAFSAYAAVFWPSISLVVDKRAFGTAYGFTLAMQNLMLAVTPLLVGFIHDKTLDVSHGYFWTEIFLLGLTLAGITVTLWLRRVDRKTGDVLDAVYHVSDTKNTKIAYNEVMGRQDDIELAEKTK